MTLKQHKGFLLLDAWSFGLTFYGLDTDISTWTFVVPVIYVHCATLLLK
jgi:hypothetical protein